MQISRLNYLALVGVAMSVLLTGCSPSAEPSVGESDVFAGSPDDYTRAMYLCLTEAGLDASLVESDDGTGLTIASKLGAGQTLAEQSEANEQCSADLPPRPEPAAEADFKEMFDHLFEQYECVVEMGMQPLPPPTFQTFYDQARSKTLDWDPFSGLTPDEVALVQRPCARDSSGWW